jgi:AraC-like DNA-binding protein
METVVYRSESVRIVDCYCPGHISGRGSEEESTAYQVVLPRKGIFIRHLRGESIVGDSNHALFFNRNETYQVSHPVKGGDSCTVLVYSAARIQDCLAYTNPNALDIDAHYFTETHAPTSSELDLLHRRLLRVAQDSDDPLVLEETSLQLLAYLLSVANKARNHNISLIGRATTLRRYNELTQAACEQLATRLGEKLNLDELAAALYVSPFHLSRVFRMRTGLSLSRYHQHLRLRAALERILDGESNLTRLAINLGFAHHSHFTSMFRREFGVPPTASRAQMSAVALRATAATLPFEGITTI